MTTTAADQNLAAVMDGAAADGSQAAESGRTEHADASGSAAVEAGESTLAAVADGNVLSGEAAPRAQEAQTAQSTPFGPNGLERKLCWRLHDRRSWIRIRNLDILLVVRLR